MPRSASLALYGVKLNLKKDIATWRFIQPYIFYGFSNIY